jgi:hypothetical protein
MAPAASMAERMAQVETRVEAAQIEIKTVADRLDRLQFWIMATFGGMLVSIFLLALTLLTKGR